MARSGADQGVSPDGPSGKGCDGGPIAPLGDRR